MHLHDPFTPATADQPLEVAHADVRRPDTLQSLFDDVDVVLASLGSAGTHPPDVATVGATAITELMTHQGLSRLITVTGSGPALPGEAPTPWHLAKRAQMRLGAPHLLADGDRHLRILVASNLDWTTVRVPLMTHESSRHYTLSTSAPPPTETSPYDAAAAATLDLLATTAWHRAAPFAHAPHR